MIGYLSEPFRIESLILCSPCCVIGCSMFAVCLGAVGLGCHQRPLYFVSLCLSCVCPLFGLALCLFSCCVQSEIFEKRRVYIYIYIRVCVCVCIYASFY